MLVGKQCEWCGAHFMVPSNDKWRSARRFCGKSCSAKRARENERANEDQRFIMRLAGHPSPENCWLWSGSTSTDGYGQTVLRQKVQRAHRAAYEMFVGKIPQGLWVLHRCDTPLCCNPAHLFLGTCQDNVTDMIQKGRKNAPRGERNGRAKLTWGQVSVIRERNKKNGESACVIARELGMARSNIEDIIRCTKWVPA